MHAYSSYRVQQALNFGKQTKPVVESIVTLIDLLTVGNCDREAIVPCVSAFLISNNDYELMTCIKRAAPDGSCLPPNSPDLVRKLEK